MLQKAELSCEADSENYLGGSSETIMYYIGLDVHKKTISYCVKEAAGHVHREGKIGATRGELDAWIKTLPQPRMMAMEAYDLQRLDVTKLADRHSAGPDADEMPTNEMVRRLSPPLCQEDGGGSF